MTAIRRAVVVVGLGCNDTDDASGVSAMALARPKQLAAACTTFADP